MSETNVTYTPGNKTSERNGTLFLHTIAGVLGIVVSILAAMPSSKLPAWLPAAVLPALAMFSASLQKNYNDNRTAVKTAALDTLSQVNEPAEARRFIAPAVDLSNAGKLACMILFALLMLPGCAAVAPGQDAFAVNGERALKSGIIAIDSVLVVESQNRQLVRSKAPAVADALDKVRVDAPPIIHAATQALKTYEASGSAADRSAADKALAALDAIVASASTYMIEVKAAHN